MLNKTSASTSVASHTVTPTKQPQQDEILSNVYPVDLYMMSSPSLLTRIEDDPTRCHLRNPGDIYTQEKLRMASQYLQEPSSIDKGLLLIEQLLNAGDIAFEFPQEWWVDQRKGQL